MAQGVYGSTLNDELNRLANGGTYPPISEYLDQAGAAKKWAIASGITPTETNTVGVINEIAGFTSRNNYLDFSGVCNYLAGTSGLAAAEALRQLTGTPPVSGSWADYDPSATWATTSSSITWLTV